MSTNQDALSADIAQAITALTAAARRSTSTLTGEQRFDFGEIACRVLTAVAANVGGIDALLAGRPGSWEADYVRQIVQSTAGPEDQDVQGYRTEPVRLLLDEHGDSLLSDFGIESLWDEALQLVLDQEQAGTLTPQQATTLCTRIDDLWDQDRITYREAYLAAVGQALVDRGLSCGVEVVDPTSVDAALVGEWDPFIDELNEHARTVTPLPMTGQTPDWTEGSPADALRRAGLTYTARAQQTPGHPAGK